ncbi:hypothetical protein [Chitinophaga barathri]|uniref:Uncharacterized protein n=1 Tax=Chitinophaga barathri TaxID=1647451 RepID=A0A3N4MRQ3_9BACT|nr:hypothetical protein [Chitinophaga barathri]RPD42249.1 hypothetical protein EG028_03455 [Chitinophaga barathri]
MNDDIDFSLILHKHGWATLLVNIKGEVHQIGASSSLSDPLYDIASLLLSLLNNENEIRIMWWEEPGWNSLWVKRDDTQHHILSIEIGSSLDQHGKEKYEKIAGFQIKLKQFLVIMFYQLKKIYHLLPEKSFATEREGEFPYELYDKLIEKISMTFPRIL